MGCCRLLRKAAGLGEAGSSGPFPLFCGLFFFGLFFLGLFFLGFLLICQLDFFLSFPLCGQRPLFRQLSRYNPARIAASCWITGWPGQAGDGLYLAYQQEKQGKDVSWRDPLWGFSCI